MDKLIRKYKDLPVQVRASIWFLICGFLQKGILVLTTPVFTRLLTPAEYGNFTVFNSWLGIVSIFVSLNLGYGVFAQGLVKFEDKRKEFVSSMQGLSSLLVLVWAVIYLIWRDFWNSLLGLTTVQMFAMLVMIWAGAVFTFWASEQRVSYKYRALVLITLVVSVLRPALGVVLVLHAEDKVTARILGIAIVDFTAYTGLGVVQMFRGKKFYCEKFWRHALMFNLPLIPHYLSQTILGSSDRIMISSMVGDAEAGIYGLANSLSHVMTLFNSALMQTLSPWIYQKIKKKQTGDIAPIAYSTLMLIAAVNLVLIILAPEAVAIFAPESYRNAIWVVPPLAMGAYFTYSYDLYAKFAFYYEKTGFIMAASVGGAVLNIILNYVFIGIFGYIAAGYTSLFCFIVYCAGHYYFMNRVCDKFCDGSRPYELRIILGITIAFLALGFLAFSTYRYPVLRYGLVLIAFVVFLVKVKDISEFAKKVVDLRN